MNSTEEIKARLDIVDVVREYIPSLKAVGVNFVSKSPFKNEKTPSFVVSPEKQIWHCFSTGKGGDIFTFVMEMEGLSFVEALKILALKAGVVLKRENAQEQSQRNKLLDIMEDAVNFYNQKLSDSSEAEGARNYLKQRGLLDNTIMDWQIGYSTNSWNDLIDYLKNKGHNDNEIFMAGLSSKKEGGSNYYNRFRERIMFPINNINGHIVAFSARLTPEKEEGAVMGKYINSPETLIYHKSNILFGLDKAKMAIKESGFAILVEGQMDVISAHQAGIENVVASSGTAFVFENDKNKPLKDMKTQISKIKRYSSNIALCFDMDEAGQAAVDKVVLEALGEEMSIKIITLPDGKDPDELIKKDKDAFSKAVADSKHIMDYYLEKVFKDLNIEKVENQTKAISQILPVINKFKNKVEQDFWINKLAEKLGRNEVSLREEMARTKKIPVVNRSLYNQKEEVLVEDLKRTSREEMLSENLLALVVKFPVFLEYVINDLDFCYISGEELSVFYKNLIIYYNNSKSFNQEDKTKKVNYDNLKAWINSNKSVSQSNQLRLLDKLVVFGDRDFFELELDDAKNEIIKIKIALKQSFFKKRRKEMEMLIVKSEKEGDFTKANSLMGELKSLIENLNNNLNQD